MTALTSILSSDIVADSRSTINANFQNLANDITTNSSLFQTSYKTDTQTISSNFGIAGSVMAVTGVGINVGANQSWNLRTTLYANVLANADAKFTFTAPAGATGGWTNTPGTATSAMFPLGSIVGVNFGTSSVLLSFVTNVVNGSTPGSVFLGMAPNNTNADTWAEPGSNIVATRIN